MSVVKGVVNDPGRLFDESDDELERLLIGAARAEKSSPRARARTLAALGITGSAALAAGATAVAAAAPASVAVSALGKMGLSWAKLVLGLSALGTIAAAPVAYRAWQRNRVEASAAKMTARMTAKMTTTMTSETTAPLPKQAPVPMASPRLAAPEPAPAAPGNAPTPVNAADLMRELGALDGVRAALARGNAARALQRLDGYAAAFPHGHLGMEAEILRMDALARAGDSADARARALAFLRDHPNSVLAARARRYLRQ